MATCILCGKKGIFLRINNHGRCKACQEKYDLAKQEEQRIATEMRIAFEKEQLESQEHDNLFPLALHSYVVTDIETSGLNSDIDFITEISAIKVLNGKVIDKYSSLIHSDRVLSPKVESLTGITSSMLKSCQKSYETVIKEYSQFVGSYPLIGHNIDRFDFKFINKAYKEVLKSPLRNKTVDTLTLSREYIRGSQNYKLQTLASFLNISTIGAHRALADCQTTHALYEHISIVAKDIAKKKAEDSALNEIDKWIIQMTKQIFKDTDHSYFRYSKHKQYLTASCFGELYRIKTTGRIKQYFEFSHQYEPDVLRSTTLKTTPRSKTYEDSGKRIFFESEEEFMSLATVIIEIYHKQKAYVDENIAHERMAHNANDTGFIRLVATISPHYEKSVNRYLENPELIKL
ncbi:hypothetical protein E5357_06300 [Hominisplanchenecus murintestinalis]|uniref:Uncharacterized protein n=1 Tax=Hominisplanchenecus murintestinalis TaxID=2941517 RepID=A0AC61R050_9FIRM|nr:exonuclease domain-containing protein [Hominisplanchenecus murintestinalis]TGX99216.1 hypothetical protein E5357_06300 [Hominisplanchenecus murintestinalis]